MFWCLGGSRLEVCWRVLRRSLAPAILLLRLLSLCLVELEIRLSRYHCLCLRCPRLIQICTDLLGWVLFLTRREILYSCLFHRHCRENRLISEMFVAIIIVFIIIVLIRLLLSKVKQELTLKFAPPKKYKIIPFFFVIFFLFFFFAVNSF